MQGMSIRKGLSDGDISQAIDRFTSDLFDATSTPVSRVQLHVNRAFAGLSLEIVNACIQDCVTALRIDSSASVAYLLEGVPHLWVSKELDALSCWSDGMNNFCGLCYFF
jgi:hypothetical protein